ncbi:MAG: ubiquinol-cytochrome c reductase iron-sulfur subunit [Desulfobulbus sp.]|jgi:cytochrome b6-f complex iron-sulfur subunit
MVKQISPPRPSATSPSQPVNTQRRNFLRQGAQWVVAIGSALFLYPLVRFASFKMPRKPQLVEVPAPLPLSGAHSGQNFILFVKDDHAWAVSRTCTHLGCRINYLEDKEWIECPCHQSRFTKEGRCIAGPAEEDLPTFPVRIVTGTDNLVSAYIVEM